MVFFYIKFALIYLLCCGIFLRVKWGQVEIVVQCANGNKALRNLSHDMTHNELPEAIAEIEQKPKTQII